MKAKTLSPGARLAACAAAIAVVWLVVLPRVAALPAVRAQIERNEAAGIDPAAKFYSELPAMPRIVERVRRVRAVESPVATEPRLRMRQLQIVRSASR